MTTKKPPVYDLIHYSVITCRVYGKPDTVMMEEIPARKTKLQYRINRAGWDSLLPAWQFKGSAKEALDDYITMQENRIERTRKELDSAETLLRKATNIRDNMGLSGSDNAVRSDAS